MPRVGEQCTGDRTASCFASALSTAALLAVRSFALLFDTLLRVFAPTAVVRPAFTVVLVLLYDTRFHVVGILYVSVDRGGCCGVVGERMKDALSRIHDSIFFCVFATALDRAVGILWSYPGAVFGRLHERGNPRGGGLVVLFKLPRAQERDHEDRSLENAGRAGEAASKRKSLAILSKLFYVYAALLRMVTVIYDKARPVILWRTNDRSSRC